MNEVPLTPPDDSGLILHDLAAMAHHGVDVPTPGLAGLLYSGTVHSLAGEPGHGKTWFTWALVVEALRREMGVVFLDFEDGPVTAVSRLFALGLRSAGMTRLHYLQPIATLDESDLAWLTRLVEGHGVGLVVLDSVPEALALSGLDENSATDVSRWFQTVPRPLARAGASVLVVDHVTKATEGRGRWARGSGAKLAAIDGVAFTFEIVEPFSRQRSGTGTLRVAKDRHGAIGGAGQPVRSVHFDVAGGSLHSLRIEPFEELRTSDSPTSVSDRIDPWLVRDALEASGGTWWSRRDAAEALGVSTNAVGAVLGDAVAVGAIELDHPSPSKYVYRLPAGEPADI